MELSEANFNNDYDGEDFTLEVAGTKLLGQMWRPEGSPRFVYIFAHGLGAYVTFKKDFFYVILQQGGVVFGCDHIGHGRSAGARISCTMDEVVEENILEINLARERYPDLPIILHGHSMGGCASILTVLKRYDDIKDKVAGVIAEAPWISKCPQRQLNGIERIGINILLKIWPTFRLSAGVDLFSPDLDQKWVKLCDESPYYSHKLTPRLYMSVEAAQQFIHENPQLWPKELPLLFLQGDQDRLVDPIDNDKWIKSVLEREGMEVTYKLYENCPHVMLKCPKRKEVITDMLEFINKRIH